MLGTEVSWPDLVLGLVAGFLLGWIIEWVLDRAARRREQGDYDEELDAMQSALDEALVTKSAALHELDVTQEERDNAIGRIKALETHVGQLTMDNKMFEEEVTESRTRLRQLTALEQANKTLRKKLTSAETRARDLNTQNEGLNADVQTLSSIQTEAEQYKARVEQLEAEKQTLRDKLAQTETELATMGAQYSTNMEDIGDVDELRASYQQSQLEIQRLRANATTNTADSERVDALHDQIAELEARLESAEEQLLHEQNRVVAAEVKLQNMADKLTDERLHAQAVEQELESIRSGGAAENSARSRAELESHKAEIRELRAQLSNDNSAEAISEEPPLFVTMDDLPPDPITSPHPATNGNGDRLQQINGIGNVFAGRLEAAGIKTFAQLAQLSPERAVEIVKAKPWQVADAEAWITQAQEFSAS